MERFSHNKKTQLYIRNILIALHVLGLIALATPFSHHLTLSLLPLGLLFNTAFLILFHRDKNLRHDIPAFLLLLILGFMIEVAGVFSGAIFGIFFFGDNLGPKIWETPLVIGFNWAIMVYLTANIVEKIKLHVAYKILLGALLMVGYDIIMEIAGPKLELWEWLHYITPFKNYVAWFIVSLILHAALRLFKITLQNPLATTVFVLQTFFFMAIAIFF